jgi:branched-chain amino acid transport system permease protein
LVGLALAPFLFPGAKALSVAAKALVFILLVASFDLLLGYTGIVSFAHTMFFGIGAYGVAIASTRMEPGLRRGAVGTAQALGVSLLLSLVIGLFSLRVKAIFFAMITLAVASAFQTLASQAERLHRRRRRPDLQEPRVLSPAFQLLEEPHPGRQRRRQADHLLPAVRRRDAAGAGLLRIVNSPFGRVLQAIRENDFRAEAIGFRTVVYRTWSNVLSALFATLAGALLALWLRYVGPDTTLSFEIMIDILLIVVIGGMGTMYGAVVGAVLFVLAQNYLQDLLKLAGSSAGRRARAGAVLTPDRWLLWLGVLFVLSVYHFPTGIVGRLRRAAWPARRLHPERPAMPAQSLYLACEGREIHVTEWGQGTVRTGADRLARPGAHRARHGRHRGATGAALARDLPRHAGPRLEPVEPAAGRRILPGLLRKLAVSLVDQLGIQQMHWLGTSMGGAIGLRAAAGRLRGRIQRLVLNDIGPQLAEPAIERIRSYAGSPPAFATMGELEAYFRTVYKPYGWLSDAQWRLLAETSMRRLPDGRVTPHYDPAMVQQFMHHPADYDQWDAWDTALTCCPCCACAASIPTCCCPTWPRRCAPRGPACRGGHHRRLRPCAGTEHARPDRAGRALPGRVARGMGVRTGLHGAGVVAAGQHDRVDAVHDTLVVGGGAVGVGVGESGRPRSSRRAPPRRRCRPRARCSAPAPGGGRPGSTGCAGWCARRSRPRSGARSARPWC